MPKYLEFEVSLREVRPKIWRRFLIREAATFQELHEAIQVACGWANYHLFAFREPGREGELLATIPGEPALDDPEPDAKRVKLSKFFIPSTRSRGGT
jgi:hypothetical protein